MTNLPELPEGYFRRVRHPVDYERSFYSTTRLNESKLHVSLIEDYSETTVSRVNRGKNALTNWFFAGETVKQTETLQATIELYSRECKGVHQQAVVNAANVIMKEWTTQQETAKLIGDYPPKKWDYNKEETA